MVFSLFRVIYKIGALIAIVSMITLATANAQDLSFLSAEEDTAYVTDLSDKLMVRALAMQKFNKYTLGEYGFSENLTYRATKNYHLGVGFTYDWVGANLTFRLPYPDEKKAVHTRFFDLQSFFYFTKAVVDLYAISYKGYNLDNYNIGAPQRFREDLKIHNYGLNVQYILNHKRFSYRAAFVNNQIQRKSAGSVLVGAGLHYTHASGDSAIIPRDFHGGAFLNSDPFNISNSITLLVNAGYGYTFVYKENYFVTAALVAGPGINYVRLKTEATDAKDNHVHSGWHGVFRGAAGYNGEVYAMTLQYTNYVGRNNIPITDGWQQLQTGGARVTITRRFNVKKKFAETFDELEEELIPKLN